MFSCSPFFLPVGFISALTPIFRHFSVFLFLVCCPLSLGLDRVANFYIDNASDVCVCACFDAGSVQYVKDNRTFASRVFDLMQYLRSPCLR